MNSGGTVRPEVCARAKGIAFGTLGIIAVSALSGAAAAILITRAVQGGVETVSTISLLTFFLITVLFASAMVLAIVAIALSRMAERTIARKSEEMNALQVAMIAQAAAIERSLTAAVIAASRQEEFMPPGERAATVGKISTAEPELTVSAPVTDEIRRKTDKKYSDFKEIILLGAANYPGVISRKIGEGQYRTEGDDLVDGVFIIQNEKVAVCTFCTSSVITDRFMGEVGDSFNGFLRSLVNELKRGHFTRIFMVFDGQLASTSPYAKALSGLSGRIDAETFSRFELFEGTPAVVIPELTERVSQLMEETPVAEEPEVPELSFRRQMGA